MADPVYRPDPRRDADAAVIADGAGQWLHITLRESIGSFRRGERFYGIPSSKADGSVYYTNLRYCSCKDYEQRGQGCKHQRAALLHAKRVRSKRQQQTGSAEEAGPTLALATEAETELAFAEVATRLRGDGAGSTYTRLMDAWLPEGH